MPYVARAPFYLKSSFRLSCLRLDVLNIKNRQLILFFDYFDSIYVYFIR